MMRSTLTCGAVVLALGTGVSLWGCDSKPGAGEGPDTAQAKQASAPVDSAAGTRREQALLDDLAVANRILARELAILDVQGHVTARSRTNPNHYYIARFIAPGDVTTSDFVENDLDSHPVDGPRNDQAREIYLHGEIYKARPDVMAVVHAHTPEFVAFGLSSVPLWSGDSILPVFDLRPFNRGRSGIISTPELGKAMAAKMGNSGAVLLWGHGIALGAPSIAEAITRAGELRDSARVQEATIAAGGTWKPQPHPADEAASERTWSYYQAAVVRDMGGKVLVTAPPPPTRPSDAADVARRDVALANRILASADLGVLDAVGIVSVRNPKNPNSYFVAPKAGDVIERDITKAEAGTQGLSIHDEIYRTRPEVNAVLYARTPEIVAFTGAVPLRAAVNGGNFIGGGLPVFNMGSLDSNQPILSNPALGRGVAAALDKKGAVLLSGHGIVLTAGSIYNLADRAFQVRQNAIIQQQALALRGKVTYLVDLPAPREAAPPAPAQPAQQLGPPEGRAWVYWSQNLPVD
jgi:ribulose-5-phosphate 4-epimerase/fuculose-1-phosphate aldolase